MRHSALSLVLCCVSVIMSGCVSNSGPSPDLVAALDSRSDCAVRYQAAQKVTSVQERDLALSQIALSAVDCRNDAVLRECIDGIADPALRDDTAAECAVNLAKAGRGQEAATIANAILNQTLRTKTLETINQTPGKN